METARYRPISERHAALRYEEDFVGLDDSNIAYFESFDVPTIELESLSFPHRDALLAEIASEMEKDEPTVTYVTDNDFTLKMQVDTRNLNLMRNIKYRTRKPTQAKTPRYKNYRKFTERIQTWINDHPGEEIHFSTFVADLGSTRLTVLKYYELLSLEQDLPPLNFKRLPTIKPVPPLSVLPDSLSDEEVIPVSEEAIIVSENIAAVPSEVVPTATYQGTEKRVDELNYLPAEEVPFMQIPSDEYLASARLIKYKAEIVEYFDTLLESNSAEKINFSQIARRFGTSRQHVHQLFYQGNYDQLSTALTLEHPKPTSSLNDYAAFDEAEIKRQNTEILTREQEELEARVINLRATKKGPKEIASLVGISTDRVYHIITSVGQDQQFPFLRKKRTAEEYATLKEKVIALRMQGFSIVQIAGETNEKKGTINSITSRLIAAGELPSMVQKLG